MAAVGNGEATASSTGPQGRHRGQLEVGREFGLAAGVFTENLDMAMKFARELETGNIHINWGPGWRQDLMPYGGLKNSGFGKEGPRYAVAEMTDLKMVVLHLR